MPSVAALSATLERVFPRRVALAPDLKAIEDAGMTAFASEFRAIYAAAPAQDAEFNAQWGVLREHAYAAYEAFRGEVEIQFADHCSYSDPTEIRADIVERDRLVITREHSLHPAWTEHDNCVFRVGHDIIPHVIYGREFSLAGEVLAFHDHLARAPAGCELALFTELVVYACIRYTHGAYPEQQKAAAFPRLYERYCEGFTLGLS